MKFVKYVMFAILLVICVSHSPKAWSQNQIQPCSAADPNAMAPGNCGNPYATKSPSISDGSAPVVDYMGAFAIDSRQKLSGSWGYGSSNEAEQSAMQSCEKGGGEHCVIINGAFTNVGAVAMDAMGATYLRGSVGNYWGHRGFGKAAEKNAMKACSELSKVGGCHLLAGAVFPGSNYGIEPSENQKALSMTSVQLLALSRDRSEKKYLGTVATEIDSSSSTSATPLSGSNAWGAFAYNASWKTGSLGLPLSASHDQPSRERAEQAALANCPNCKIIETVSNACMGVAHPSRNSPFIENGRRCRSSGCVEKS